MIRPYLPFFLVLFALTVPTESAGQPGNLTQLNSVAINVTLSKDAKEMGLTEVGIKDQSLVLLKTKLPRLKVTKYTVLVSLIFGST